MFFSTANTKSVPAARGQSLSLLAPLIAAVFAISLLLVPVIHSAATSTSDIPLFDPGKYTATELSTSTLNDGIPDVWKIHYGLSTTDPNVANADYNGSGVMNLEKYRLNIHPLALAEPPPEATPPKAAKSTVKKSASSSSSDALLKNMDFSDGAGPKTQPTSGGYNVKFQWNYNDWGDGTKFGWKAVKGSIVEVWKDPSGNQFIELNSNANSSGIEQKIANPQPGTYLLSWRHLGRHEKKAGDNSYSVHVFAKDSKGDTGSLAHSTPIATSPPEHIYHAPSSIDYSKPSDYPAMENWDQELVVFTLTKEIIATHPDIWIAFVSEQEGTYGAFIANVNLSPIDLAVDANRDGTITRGEHASKEKPFRFWINNDSDLLETEKEDEGTIQYFQSGKINNTRDLEDFNMLLLTIPKELWNMHIHGKASIGMKWKNVSGTCPGVKVFRNADVIHESKDYLWNLSKAEAQMQTQEVLGEFCMATIETTSSVRLSNLVLTHSTENAESDVTVRLLFEASAQGQGQLCLVIMNNG